MINDLEMEQAFLERRNKCISYLKSKKSLSTSDLKSIKVMSDNSGVMTITYKDGLGCMVIDTKAIKPTDLAKIIKKLEDC